MKAGLVYGPMPHHLDHIAIIAHMMSIPLIVTEESLATQAKLYYPGLKVIYWDPSCVAENLVSSFETIFCSMPRPLFDEAFFFAQKLLKKKVRTIWLPHGNSDKGYQAPSMEALEHDTTAWVYGQKMIDFLKEKKVFDHLDVTVVGNFRYAYYQKHRAFYDGLVDQIIPTTKKVILYAPTWKDTENSSSFDEAFPILIKNLPPEYALVVKPHPNLVTAEIPQRSDVFSLKDFPPIYPLLNRTAIYIGDMSSIGYDFLTFNRPMYFLNPNRRDPKNDPGLFLHRCGATINPEDYDKLYDLLDDQVHLSSLRKEIYDYTFRSVKQIDI